MRKKFTPTEAQKAASQERRERFKDLAQSVSRLTEDQRMAYVDQFGAIITVECRKLSPFNSCLILSQCPTASMVGGFAQWLKAGRCVRKGQHGMMIWVPAGKGKAGSSSSSTEANAIDSDSPTSTDIATAGEETTSTGETTKRRSSFIIGTVFDISQTDPKADYTHEQNDAIADALGKRLQAIPDRPTLAPLAIEYTPAEETTEAEEPVPFGQLFA